MTTGWYRIIRMMLWLTAVFIALLPAILESFPFSSQPLLDTNNALLRDYIFVVVPASALGLSTVLDYLCMNFKLLAVESGSKFALAVFGIILNILAMMSGLVGFLVIPNNQLTASAGSIVTFLILILLALLIGGTTEFLVSGDNHRFHLAKAEPALNRQQSHPLDA